MTKMNKEHNCEVNFSYRFQDTETTALRAVGFRYDGELIIKNEEKL